MMIYYTLQGVRTSLDELKVIQELKQLKELKEHLGETVAIINLFTHNDVIIKLDLCAFLLFPLNNLFILK